MEEICSCIGNQAERRPIFVTDAIKDSILYIGINPNFYERDDDILLHSAMVNPYFMRMSVENLIHQNIFVNWKNLQGEYQLMHLIHI